jgi:deoxyribodipyrimidine photo-lyase
MIWEPTRAAGLARLESFLPSAGRAYASGRNVDRGPDDRSNVSALSPWIRRRLITEEEVIAAVLKRHSFSAAEKFVQEVVWRTYWKGWLEMRPSVLWRFDAERIALKF